MNVDEKKYQEIVSEWAKDPQKMLAWRTEEYKYLLLLLDSKIRNPGEGRNSDAVQNRAIVLLNGMMSAMDAIKDAVPATCPECGAQFVPGK